MIRSILYSLLFLWALPAKSQYYLRGEVKDDKNRPLPNVRIFVHSSRSFYQTGAPSGTFGINERALKDSLTLTLDGYETLKVGVITSQWQTLIMKPLADITSKNRPKLISLTKDYSQHSGRQWLVTDETYFQLIENEFVVAKQFPNTGYSMNVNKASYSNVRRFIKMGSIVPPDAVRTEELINYFNLKFQPPTDGKLFNMQTQLTSCPWNKDHQLFYINASAKKLDFEKVPPGNFVFLIDVSGSMDMPNRLPLVKAAFQLFTKNLRDVDTVSIVTYGGYVQIWLEPTSGKEKEKILRSIEELEAQGDTPGESAIKIAYQLAQKHFIKEGNNRVILATDGDFNVGQTSEKALEDLISNHKQSGVYLTCLGVGMGNFKDSKLQTLAKKGNGNYAYLDDIQEAERVLVKELTQTFYAVADDVFMNVKFDSTMVKEYRLIGFDNKKEALADSVTNLEGGEVGSGSSVLALFELLPNQPPLSNQKPLAELTLKYSLNNDSAHHEYHYQAYNNYLTMDQVDKEIQLATAVTMFALKLRESKFSAGISWTMIRELVKNAVDPHVYIQTEFSQLVGKAIKLYGNKKKWKEQ